MKESAGPQPASLRRGSVAASALLSCTRYTDPFHTTTLLKMHSLAESSAPSRHCNPPWACDQTDLCLTSTNSTEQEHLHLRRQEVAIDNRMVKKV